MLIMSTMYNKNNNHSHNNRYSLQKQDPDCDCAKEISFILLVHRSSSFHENYYHKVKVRLRVKLSFLSGQVWSSRSSSKQHTVWLRRRFLAQRLWWQMSFVLRPWLSPRKRLDWEDLSSKWYLVWGKTALSRWGRQHEWGLLTTFYMLLQWCNGYSFPKKSFFGLGVYQNAGECLKRENLIQKRSTMYCTASIVYKDDVNEKKYLNIVLFCFNFL